MDRRNVLLGLGAVTPLLAAASIKPARAAVASPLDPATYVAQTAQVGTLSYTLCQLAPSRASNFFVKGFATLESQEQTAFAQALTNTFDPAPAPLTPAQQQMVQMLSSLSGAAFDTAFVKAQIDGHMQLQAIQTQFLTGNTDPTSDLTHGALIAVAFINTHLAVLGQLQLTLAG